MLTRIRPPVLVSSAIAAVVAAVALTGCGSGGGGTPSASVTASTTPASARATSTAPSSAGASGVAGCDVAPWRTAPITVTHHVAVPPVPVITAVRVAQHPECGYDRVVLDVHGPIPSYSVRYVDHVISDASGQTIPMPGVRYLLIIVQPAQAHTDAGMPTVFGGVRRPGYPALVSWALAGDFEGYVRIGLGLSGHVSIRTGELAGRIYIDVKE